MNCDGVASDGQQPGTEFVFGSGQMVCRVLEEIVFGNTPKFAATSASLVGDAKSARSLEPGRQARRGTRVNAPQA